MNFIDEQNRAFGFLKLVHHRLEAFLEIATIARARKERAHIERIDGGVSQNVRHFPLDNALGEALGNRRLADAGFADIERVVLGSPGKNLDGPFDLVLAADQRIDFAFARLLIEVDAIGAERLLALLDDVFAFGFLIGARYGVIGFLARHLGDAVRNVVDGIETRHFLLLQIVDGMALALGENRHQHVRTGHLFAPRRLNMDGRALQDALETGGRLGFIRPAGHEPGEFLVDVI